MMNIEGGGHGGVKEEIRVADESSGSQDDCNEIHHDFDDNQLECARAKVGEVREENERLKLHLDRITKEYKTLQMKLHDTVQQESHKHNNDSNIINVYDQETEEENQLVSLSLGRVTSDSRKDEKSTKVSEPSSSKQSLSLGLESKLLQTASKSVATENLSNRSTSNSFEELKDEAGATWPPSKVVMKVKRSGDDEVSQQTPIAKKARVSVRARCDTPTMNDGCQWRKYGQKISKGNPCPRAYYRCTVAPNCPVRKQVQRCWQDMSILITTYEGNHNHPLSMSATAMSSTTSAAASMLLSSSSTTSTTPNSSSSSPSSFPTITLDLTSSNNPIPSRPTTLTFSSNMAWGGAYATQQRYPINFGLKNGQLPHHQNNGSTENVYQQMKNHVNVNNGSSSNHIMNQQYNLAAATKAITADPTFQSALAAALTSVIGNQGGEQSHKMKWGELFPTINSGSRYLMNNSSASDVVSSQQPGGFMFLPPSLPFSTPKSTSTSPSETRDQNI